MQSQVYVAGQHGQLTQVFKGGTPLPKKNALVWRKPWHSDTDLSLRREMFLHITKLVQKHGFESKLAHEVETALYVDAESKEDYGNLITLEHRICSLFLRIKNNQKAGQLGALQGHVLPESTFISTGNTSYTSPVVGRISSNHGARVLPSTGNAATPLAYNMSNHASMASYDNLLASSTGQPPLSGFNGFSYENKGFMSGVSMPKAGSRMIPTPGQNTNGEVSFNVYGAVDGAANKVRQQVLPFGTNGTSFQRDGLLRNNAELTNSGLSNCLQVIRPDQMFTNIGSSLQSSLYNSSAKPDFGHPASHFSLPVDQSLLQQQYGVAGGDFASITDNPNLGNFRTSSIPVCANPSSVPSMTADSFSAMLSEHPDTNLSQQLFAQQFSQSGPLPNSPTFSVISQEHQQPGRTLVMSNQIDYKDSETFFSKGVAPHLTSSAQGVNVDTLAGQQNQHLRSNRLFYLQKHHCQQQQQLQKYQNQALSFENKEKIWMAIGAGNGSLLQFEPDSLQSQACPQVLSVDQHSEQTCQASSADTGQSEVVSNDESLAPFHNKDACKQDLSTSVKLRQWLLVMFWHVNRCTNPQQCGVRKCEAGRTYWKHLITCRDNACRCSAWKQLLNHHNRCRNSKCVVCGPLRSYLSPQAVAARSKLKEGQLKPPASNCTRAAPANEADSPSAKRAKLDVISSAALVFQQETYFSSCKGDVRTQACCQDKLSSFKDEYISNRRGSECAESVLPKTESPMESSVSAGSHSQDLLDAKSVQVSNWDHLQVKAGLNTVAAGQEASQADLKIVNSSDIVNITKKNVSGITYLECLTSEQIRQHISSLRKWIGQSKAKAEKNQALEHNMSSSACSACAVETLHFDPIPVFCTQCGCRIKRNAVYHTSGSGDNMVIFCGPCYSAIRSDTVESDGVKVQKSSLEKKRNDEQRVEAWVECDKCKKWQHQICGLFNARINKERSVYVCPECCITEIERGERVPRAANSVLGAKDLPRTMLSDFVEERLARKLDDERAERAKASGKCLNEVPKAQGLVVRVISSVDKRMEVKPRFLEIFQQDNYPKDFVYKSKMLMLFQEIEGVEVCLFGMYVQEFGAESPQPNHRHVYLSYLDSVKYFRPDVKTVTGEALRTYVYHEILIAYLDYCKRRGFSSCYIWACPPLKGDDYILYCHPEIQKTPKTDKLRDWYLSMIAKAKKENIVHANKNLYDYYFTSNDECKAKVTATRLPYFDGDYWPGAAEDILQQLQEEEEGVHSSRRGKTKKLASKRTTKTSSHADGTGNVSKDLQLMHKLGQSIAAMKEDFIMVHLHHACSRCRNFITLGHRWFCQICGDNFQLCRECHDDHEQMSEEERHPAGKKESHPLFVEKVKDVPPNTLDRDEIMECEYFDNRQAFLSLCQGNQYQYDTLRRAKHSSMMILYHLHNPNAPAFVSSCIICHIELEAGHGWKCNTCLDYDICTGCYSGQEVKHPHKLVARTIPADQNATNSDDRKQRILQLRMMLVVLAHCAKCKDALCQFAKCKNMKDLFRHGNSCPKRAGGGCPLCKRMWFLLTAHARSCKESVCTVPRCKDIRLHLSRAQHQQESRRRAAFNEMIRQRTAETVGTQ
ncbi:hypothetical protein L7F22_049297 [Adiantum nelumboides]|nr:hypothetical protein [Adiantum nelumboides]